MSNALNNTFFICKILDVFFALKHFCGDKLLNVTKKKVYSPTTTGFSVLHPELQAPSWAQVA